MRSKKDLKTKLPLLILTVILAVAALSACNTHKPDHYDHLVTFNFNTGNDIEAPEEMYLGVLDPEGKGSLVSIRPGYSSNSFAEPMISGYYIENWYLPALDSEGKVQVDEDGKVLLQAEPWDFATDRVTEDITLYANLAKSPVMRFIDADTLEKVGEIDGRRPGEVATKPEGSLAPSKSGYTFMQNYYKDKDMKEVFEFPYTFGNETEPVDVYVNFIEGEWSLVSTTLEMSSALTNNRDIYLLNDIDYTGMVWGSATYTGEFNGNGHTLKGITLNYTSDNTMITARRRTSVGIFSRLLGRTYMHDVNFEDVTLSVRASDAYGANIYDVRVGMLAAEVSEGAVIENVTVTGIIYASGQMRQYVESNGIALSPWIARNLTAAENIVNCDYSGVIVKYMA